MVGIVLHLLRKHIKPKIHYYLWIITLFPLLVPFIPISFIDDAWLHLPSALPSNSVDLVSNSAMIQSTTLLQDINVSVTRIPKQFLLIAFWIWVLGCFIFLIPFMKAILGIRQIKKQAVNVRVPVIKSRDQKAQGRRFHQPVPNAVFYGIGHGIVAEALFGELHRADAAQDKFVNVIRSVEHLRPVRGLRGNIVGAVNQDNVVIFPVIIMFDHPVIKLFQQRLVL